MHRRLKWSLLSAALLLAAAIAWFCLKPARPFHLPAGPGPVKVAIGFSHAVILAGDGSLWVWGDNQLGWPALGLGKVQRQLSPRRLGSDTNWVDIAADGDHTLALKADGSLWGWGGNFNWQIDATRTPRATPAPSMPGNDWKQIATGLHVLALKRNGSLWAWGNNWSGNLGTGSTNNTYVPLQVGSSTNWVKVWANNVNSVGHQADGSLWFWGHLLLQFGPKGTNILSPRPLSSDTNWVDVGLGDFMGFAIKSDGTLWAWGADADIFTGAPDPALNAQPRQVGTNSDWLACSPFANSCLLLMKKDRSLWALDDSLDQRAKRLGNSAWKMQPVQARRIELPKDIVAFAGGHHRLGVAVTRDGEVWTWGMALGERSPGDAFVNGLSTFLNRVGIRTRWGQGQPDPVMREKPWRLGADE